MNMNIGISVVGCKSTNWDILSHEYVTERNIQIKLKIKAEPPAVRLARAAVYVALKNDEICPILYDKLSVCTNFCVGACGHVFSNEARDLDKCPLCMSTVMWAHVAKSELEY